MCGGWCSKFLGLSPGTPPPPDPLPLDRPKFHSFFSPTGNFIPLKKVFSLNSGGVFEDRDAQMCTLGLSGCRVEARRPHITGPLGLHTTTRELQTRTFQGHTWGWFILSMCVFVKNKKTNTKIGLGRFRQNWPFQLRKVIKQSWSTVKVGWPKSDWVHQIRMVKGRFGQIGHSRNIQVLLCPRPLLVLGFVLLLLWLLLVWSSLDLPPGPPPPQRP